MTGFDTSRYSDTCDVRFTYKFSVFKYFIGFGERMSRYDENTDCRMRLYTVTLLKIHGRDSNQTYAN